MNKKNIRLITSIVLFIPSFPIFTLAGTIIFIIPILGIMMLFDYPFSYLGNRADKDDLIEILEMVTTPFWVAISIWITYVKEGKFDY